MLTRRDLVRASCATLLAAPAIQAGRRRRDDELRLAVAGLNGRGALHIEALRNIEGVRVVALVDVDEEVLAREVAKFRERDERVGAYGDLRKVLERNDVDAITIATPNHWHALQAIWACQSGKDVYLEAPITHQLDEGTRVVEAARRYGRIVQSGLQGRSSTGVAEALAWTRAGNLGTIRIARGLCYAERPSIGNVQEAQKIPDQVDYDMWCGPAPLQALERARLHHDWRWTYATGNGELGNEAVHQLDLCRRALGENRLPTSVQSIGARLGYEDDGETPNTQLVLFGYEVPFLLEIRGLPEQPVREASTAAGLDVYQGVSVGSILHCEGGTLAIEGIDTAVARDASGAEIRRWTGTQDHFENFIAAVRSRKSESLRADVVEGHLTSSLCHLALISQRLGVPAGHAEVLAAVANSDATTETFQRLCLYLDAHAIDPEKTPLQLGPCLTFDPGSERFLGDERANRLLMREYREPYVMPEQI